MDVRPRGMVVFLLVMQTQGREMHGVTTVRGKFV